MNTEDEVGIMTPLKYAVYTGDVDMVLDHRMDAEVTAEKHKLITEAKAKGIRQYTDWRTSRNKYCEGLYVTALDMYQTQIALHCASSEGDFSVVRTLVEAGADVNRQDEDGTTALMDAAYNGHDKWCVS